MKSTSTLSLAEIVRIEKLLARLAPAQVAVCRVPGCVHTRAAAPAQRKDTPALAA
jgi:hypothetical protein